MTRDPDSGKGRRDRQHQDWSGKDPTRPGPHAPALDDTIDDFPGGATQVDQLRSRVDRVAEVVADHAMVIAERHEMPSSEAWSRLEARLDDMAARVAVCEDERKARAWRTKVWTWAKGIGGGGILTALIWAVVQIGNAGADRERAKARAALLDRLVDDVKEIREVDLDAIRDEIRNETRTLRESFAADHALLQLLIGKGFP